jgi:hypothetical protein
MSMKGRGLGFANIGDAPSVAPIGYNAPRVHGRGFGLVVIAAALSRQWKHTGIGSMMPMAHCKRLQLLPTEPPTAASDRTRPVSGSRRPDWDSEAYLRRAGWWSTPTIPTSGTIATGW